MAGGVVLGWLWQRGSGKRETNRQTDSSHASRANTL
jgi:hypothetical protein